MNMSPDATPNDVIFSVVCAHSTTTIAKQYAREPPNAKWIFWTNNRASELYIHIIRYKALGKCESKAHSTRVYSRIRVLDKKHCTNGWEREEKKAAEFVERKTRKWPRKKEKKKRKQHEMVGLVAVDLSSSSRRRRRRNSFICSRFVPLFCYRVFHFVLYFHIYNRFCPHTDKAYVCNDGRTRTAVQKLAVLCERLETRDKLRVSLYCYF